MNVYIYMPTIQLRTQKNTYMEYMDWYNKFRPHSSLGRKTPEETYVKMPPMIEMAVWKTAENPPKKQKILFKQREPLLAILMSFSLFSKKTSGYACQE